MLHRGIHGYIPKRRKIKNVKEECDERKVKYIPCNTSTSPLKFGDVIINKVTGNKMTVAKVSKKYCLVDMNTKQIVKRANKPEKLDKWVYEGM